MSHIEIMKFWQNLWSLLKTVEPSLDSQILVTFCLACKFYNEKYKNCYSGKESILAQYDKFKAGIVFGAENFCWPDVSLKPKVWSRLRVP